MQSQNQSIIPATVTVSLVNGQPMVSSRVIADVFDKNHYDVLRDIRDLNLDEIDPDFNARNFAAIFFEDNYGRPQPAYNLTEEGFSLLVMGYRGEKAMRFKIAFIKEFIRMRNEIRELAVKQAAIEARNRVETRECLNPTDWVRDPRKPIDRIYMTVDRMLRLRAFTKDPDDKAELREVKDILANILTRHDWW